MPLYEYLCDTCGHRFEAIQKFSDPPLEQCPKCGAPIRKLQAAPAFQFKGSGWYITDYAKKDSVPAGTVSESSAPAKDAGKNAGSSGTGEKAGGSDAAAKAPAATKPSTP